MARNCAHARFCTLFVLFLIFVAGQAAAFDFAKVRQEIKAAVEKKPDELKLADLGYFSVLPVGQVVIKSPEYHEVAKNHDMIVLSGRGRLPDVFKGLTGRDADMVITIKPDAATSKDGKDMLCSLTGFFDAGNIGDFYGKMEDNIFREMLSGSCCYSYSNARQTLTADMFSEKAAAKFSAVLGKNFAATLYDGLTLMAPVAFNPQNAKLKAVSDFAKFLGVDKMGLVASLFLSADWRHITLKISLGDGFKMGFLPDFFGPSVPYLFVNLSEFGIGFDTTVKLPPEDKILSGVCQVSVPILLGKSPEPEAQSADEKAAAAQLQMARQTADAAFKTQPMPPAKKDSAVLLGSISGIWESALGIKALDVYDLVLKGEIPTSVNSMVLGLGGRVDIGNVKMAIGAKLPIGYNVAKAAFSGSASRIPFGELLALIFKSSGEKKEKAGIPIEKLALNNVIVSVAAQDDRDLNIKAGLAFAGALEFAGQDLGKVDVRTTHSEQTGVLKPLVGFRAIGWVKEIALGPLKITGNGPDGKKGNKDDGVYLDLAYGTKTSDHFKLSGLLKIFSAEREAQVEITDVSIDVFTREKLFDLYEADLTLKGSVDPRKPEFLARARLTDTFADDAVKHTTEFLNDAVEEMNDNLEDAKEEFEDATEAVNDARKEAAKGLDAFRKDVEKFAEKVEKAENKVKRLDKKLDKKEKQLKNLKWNKFKKRARLVAQIAGLKPALAAAKFTLKTLNGLMTGKNMDKAAEGLKKVADEALKIAEKSLAETTEKMGEAQKLAEEANVLTAGMKDFGKNFKVEEAGFEASLAQVLKDKSPKLYFKAEVFGKKVVGEAQFDFSEPKKAFLTFAKAVFERLAEQDKAIGKAGLMLLESL